MRRKYHSMGISGEPAGAIDGARIAARLEASVGDRPGPRRRRGPPGVLRRGGRGDAPRRGLGGRGGPAGRRSTPTGTSGRCPPATAPVVTSGSHVDTVPAGGRYDGALGTVLALEAALALRGRVGVLDLRRRGGAALRRGDASARGCMVGTLPEDALERPARRRGRDRRRGPGRVPRRPRRPPPPRRSAAASSGSPRTSRSTSSPATSCAAAARGSASSSGSPRPTATS